MKTIKIIFSGLANNFSFFLVLVFSLIPFPANADGNNHILDFVSPIFSVSALYPQIPMIIGNAHSMPYGIGGTDAGKVMCPDKIPAPDGDISKCKNIATKAISLQNLMSNLYVNAPFCSLDFNEGRQLYPSIQDPDKNVDGKPDACSHRDMTLFNGLICVGDVFGYGWSASESIACKAVKDAQDSTGRMWRSPYRKTINNYDDSEAFSPDMDLGVMLYAVAANDGSILQNWWSWIHQEVPCLVKSSELVCTHTHKVTGEISACIEWDLLNKGKCTRYAKINETYACDTWSTQEKCQLRGLPRFCLNVNCTVRPNDIRMIEEVASHFNLALPSQLKNYDTTLSALLLHGLLPGSIVVLTFNEFMNASHYIAYNAANMDKGFKLHLEGVRILLLRLMGKGDEMFLTKAAKDLARREPDSPFFSYLLDGGPKKIASNRTIELFNKACNGELIPKKNDHGYWAWELKNGKWHEKSLWDCRFMAQFLYDSIK